MGQTIEIEGVNDNKEDIAKADLNKSESNNGKAISFLQKYYNMSPTETRDDGMSKDNDNEEVRKATEEQFNSDQIEGEGIIPTQQSATLGRPEDTGTEKEGMYGELVDYEEDPLDVEKRDMERIEEVFWERIEGRTSTPNILHVLNDSMAEVVEKR